MARPAPPSLPQAPRPLSAAVRAGASQRDITPPSGIHARNWGAARHDQAEGVHRPLTATAVALTALHESPPVVLVSVDLGWWQRPEDEWRVRGAVLDALKLDPARVLLACTHTHAGPSTCTEDADKPGGHLIAPYLDQVRQAVVEAARDAVDRVQPAVLTWATGRCDLAANRDLSDPAGDRILCGYHPGAPADDTVLVGRASDAAGRTLATIVNYACHPTTLAWDNRLISPDYVGAMREVIQQHSGGAPCLFLQGASGELAPREQYTGDLGVADAHGRCLGHAVLAAVEGMLPPRMHLAYRGAVESGAPLAEWTRTPFDPPTTLSAACIDVELPLKPLPSVAELERELAACDDRVIAERIRRKLRVVRQVGDGQSTRWPVWFWRVGDAVFVGQANEAYSVFQRVLRERFPANAIVVMNLVNGACGYLCPLELHDRNIYQVWQSPFSRDALGALTDACVRQIEGLLAQPEAR